MGRLTWLADELRKAGLRVSEVPGWKTRGSDQFHPEGMTWHATAGSRKATAQAEVNVILHGSTSAPPPIAQLMLDRDGTFYVCAAGRCNHNKTGWDGPNKGLGNTHLIGLEMANDNRGEPWPEVQLDAARRGTAAILARLNADPMRRLAAHFEHQPYATRPRGEGSTKSDPHGVDMRKERPRVAALMNGTFIQQEDDVTPEQVQDIVNRVVSQVDDVVAKVLEGPRGQTAIGKGVATYVVTNARPKPDGTEHKISLGALLAHSDTRSDRTNKFVIDGSNAANAKLNLLLEQAGLTAKQIAELDAREAAEVPLTVEQMRALLAEALPDSGGPVTPERAREAVLELLRRALTAPAQKP